MCDPEWCFTVWLYEYIYCKENLISTASLHSRKHQYETPRLNILTHISCDDILSIACFCPFKMPINRIDEIGNYTMYDFNTCLVNMIAYHFNFVFTIIISCFSPNSFECKHIFQIQTMNHSWMPVCFSFYFAHTHSFSKIILCNGLYGIRPIFISSNFAIGRK